MANVNQKKYDAKDDYPNFEGHKSLLSKYLTADIYARLRDVYTPSGYTLDRAIQNGVDNPGRVLYFSLANADKTVCR